MLLAIAPQPLYTMGLRLHGHGFKITLVARSLPVVQHIRRYLVDDPAFTAVDSELKRFNHAVKVFPEQGFWWCETPKVGCTTIKRLLLIHAAGIPLKAFSGKPHKTADKVFCSPKTMGYRRFFQWLRHDKPKGYLFIREPFSRLYSAYKDKIERPAPNFDHERQKILRWSQDQGFVDSQQTSVPLDAFLAFCALAPLTELNHRWAPQTHVTWCNHLPYTRIFSFERFHEGVMEMINHFDGIDVSTVTRQLTPKTKATTRHDLSIPASFEKELNARYAEDRRLHQQNLSSA